MSYTSKYADDEMRKAVGGGASIRPEKKSKKPANRNAAMKSNNPSREKTSSRKKSTSRMSGGRNVPMKSNNTKDKRKSIPVASNNKPKAKETDSPKNEQKRMMMKKSSRPMEY